MKINDTYRPCPEPQNGFHALCIVKIAPPPLLTFDNQQVTNKNIKLSAFVGGLGCIPMGMSNPFDGLNRYPLELSRGRDGKKHQPAELSRGRDGKKQETANQP